MSFSNADQSRYTKRQHAVFTTSCFFFRSAKYGDRVSPAFVILAATTKCPKHAKHVVASDAQRRSDKSHRTPVLGSRLV